MKTGRLSRRTVVAAGLSGLVLPRSAWPQSREREVEGGIGGTGIVGILTDLDPLIVSGHRLEIDGATRFSDGFGPVSAADLQRGDSLTVEASGQKDGLVARRVHITYALVGRIERMSEDRRTLQVNGIQVRMQSGVRAFDNGDRVAVSGLWQGAGVVGSRLSPARSNLDLVSGDVMRSGSSVRIGTVAARGPGVARLADGSFASAAGRYQTGREILRVASLENQRFTGAAGALKRLSIEGYLDPTEAAPGYRIAGLGHSFERALDLARYAEARVLFTGAYTGRFAAQRAVVLPEEEDRRRQVMRQLARS